MAERYANCTVSYEMHSDRRFDLLAQLAGWSRAEACWRMVELWARCTALQTDRPPAEEIRIHLGLRGEQLLVDATLAERRPDGSIRVLGGGLSGGDTDRFGWFAPVARRGAAGGLARKERAVRDQTGKFVSATAKPARSSDSASDHQQDHQQATSEPSKPPASYPQAPASGFRIPDQRSDSLSTHAIPPSTEPSTTPAPNVPTKSPQAPVRGDIARTNEPTLDQLWAEFELERQRVSAKLSVPWVPLLAHDQGRDDLARALVDASKTGKRAELAATVRHAIAVAGAEVEADPKELQWFSGAIFSPRNFRRLAAAPPPKAKRKPPVAAQPSTPSEPKVFVGSAELAEIVAPIAPQLLAKEPA